MWFWEKESVEYEVFKKYEPALLTIGVNLADAEVQDALEGCSYDLEDALRSAIEYALWLSEHEKEIFPKINARSPNGEFMQSSQVMTGLSLPIPNSHNFDLNL